MRVAWIALSLALFAACQIDPPPTTGRVTGLVGGWPAAPLGGDIRPAPGKTVEFHPIDGSAASTVKSGADGRYEIALPPGTYEVRLSGYQPAGLLYGRNPKTYGQWPQVTVTAGRTSHLDLIYDTGIR